MRPAPVILPQRYVHAAMLVAVTMMTAVLWMPAMLGTLAQGYELQTGTLSGLAFAELVGFLIGTLLTSNRTLVQLSRWVLIACVLIVAASACAIQLSEQPPLRLVRTIAGLGSGIGFGYGLKACAASARPTRSFGVLTASMSVMMVIGFQSMARLIESQSGADSVAQQEIGRSVSTQVFGVYAVAAALAALVFWLNRPAIGSMPDGQFARSRQLPGTLVSIGLLAIGLAFVGQGGVWAFLQVLGVTHGFSIAGTAHAMSAFAIAGIVGSLASTIAPQGWPRWMAIGAAQLVLWLGLYALYSPASLAWYVAGCAVGGFYWNFALPLMLGLLTRIDQSGQGAVLGGTMSTVGSAIGPLVAGLLIQSSGYQSVGWMTGLLCLASLICVRFVERRCAANLAGRPGVAA